MIKAHLQTENDCVTIFHDNESYNLAIFFNNKYRFWSNDENRKEIEICQKGEKLSNQDWENFKKKAKKHFDFELTDEFKPKYLR